MSTPFPICKRDGKPPLFKLLFPQSEIYQSAITKAAIIIPTMVFASIVFYSSVSFLFFFMLIASNKAPIPDSPIKTAAVRIFLESPVFGAVSFVLGVYFSGVSSCSASSIITISGLPFSDTAVVSAPSTVTVPS